MLAAGAAGHGPVLQPRARPAREPRPCAATASAMPGSSGPATAPAQLHSLRDLPPRYRGVLLDQFGVLHDGCVPYPGAIEAVQHLHAAGLKILIISNSSRRSHGALGNLERMGFPKDAFCGAITSGEVTHSMFERRPTPFWAARRRCLHLTWSARGAISLEGLGLEVTTDPELADCIVAHGTEALGTSPTGAAPQPSSPQQLRALLDACAALPRPPPMIVANPDLVTVQGAELRVMPGTLAAWYKAAGGGEIHLMGKPAGVIYDRALRLLGLPAAAVLAVGDSLEHDVAGARGAGVDAVFVAGGIHAKELGVGPPGGGAQGAGVAEGPLRELCRRHGAAPAYVIPYFAL